MRRPAILLLLLSAGALSAQEVLLPLRYVAPEARKGRAVLTLPFFDDFCDTSSLARWDFAGVLQNNGYAPLPPTVGMATLDLYDADGELYSQTIGERVGCDTLSSAPLRLDSLFQPYPRRLSAEDSVYLSFYFTTGGGYDNYWERSGDSPEEGDSLTLQFYAPQQEEWFTVWQHEGVPPDSLRSWYGTYWPLVNIAIDSAKYFQPGFRFRFINYGSLDQIPKQGYLSNADQWSVDYVYLDVDREESDTVFRDVAFVNPAPSLLKGFQAMPARQFDYSNMKDTLAMTITNLFSEELATHYGYKVYDEEGNSIYEYDGGMENAPPHMPGGRYQDSPLHSRPPVGLVLPVAAGESCSFSVVHALHEGVGGSTDLDRCRLHNDTVAFLQRFDNYYAFDDGTSENGYGLTSTNAALWLACRYALNVEDTLMAVDLYFNRVYADQNASVPFLLTVWDDNSGQPGNIIYQDDATRKPRFVGMNRFVRYFLEQPLLCSGTVYVGFQQNNNTYINLGFDRNNDASTSTFYKTAGVWQASILRGALMLRPYFGQRAFVGVSPAAADAEVVPQVWAEGRRVNIRCSGGQPVVVYDVMGRTVFSGRTAATAASAVVSTPPLRPGLYLVKAGTAAALKVNINND